MLYLAYNIKKQVNNKLNVSADSKIANILPTLRICSSNLNLAIINTCRDNKIDGEVDRGYTRSMYN